MDNIGIYCIKNKINNKVYIGISKELKRRWWHHLTALRGGYHRNAKLQNSFNKHGEECFEWSILENTDIDNLEEREIYYINKFNSVDNGYNIEGGGNHNKIVLESTRKKLSEVKKGEKNANAVINDDIAEKILTSLLDIDKEVKVIAEEFGVTVNVVYNLQMNRSYTYLMEEKREFIKNRKKIADKQRLMKAIDFINEGNLCSVACRKFKVSRNTVRKYLNEQANTEVII